MLISYVSLLLFPFILTSAPQIQSCGFCKRRSSADQPPLSMTICDTLVHSECFVAMLFDDKITSLTVKSFLNRELNINPQNYSFIGKNDIVNQQLFMRILKEDNDTVPAKLIQLGIDLGRNIFRFQKNELGQVLYFSFIEMAATCAPKLLHFLATSDIQFKRPLISSVIAAIYAGHLDNVKYLIDIWGLDVNSVYPLDNKSTILSYAVKLNQVEVVRFLLQRGARTEDENLLKIAIKNDRPSIVEILLNAGAKINKEDVNGHMALGAAIKYGKTGSVRVLLNYYRSLLDNYGSIMFHVAIFNGHLEIVKLLLEYGFALLFISANGNGTSFCHTFLHLIVFSNHLDMARYFLATVSSPYELMTDERLQSSLVQFPFLTGRLDLSDPPAVTAILFDRIEMLNILLEYGFNPNHFIFKGTTTVLHLACELKKYKMAEVLIRHGADTNALNSSGVTAFSFIEDPEMLIHLKNFNIYI